MICQHCNRHITRASSSFSNDPFSFCPYCGGDIRIESYARSDLTLEDLAEDQLGRAEERYNRMCIEQDEGDGTDNNSGWE